MHIPPCKRGKSFYMFDKSKLKKGRRVYNLPIIKKGKRKEKILCTCYMFWVLDNARRESSIVQ